MGPSQNETSESALAMEPRHGISNGEKSSTTSPDTPLDRPFSDNKHDKSSPEAVEVNSGNLLTTESPSTQVMERPTKKSYRIPSSAFAKGESKKEMEWSSASNESLFSIKLDNTSFSREQFLAWNSEEFGGEEAMNDLSPVASSSKITRGGFDAAETSMREFLRDGKDQTHEKCDNVEGRSTTGRFSHESGTSGKSFAFPIVAKAVRMKQRLAGEEPSTKLKSEKKQPQSLSLPTKLEKESSQSPAQAEQKAAAPKRWFSRFLCCSFCSSRESSS